ncbi:hypothetical protein FANTH_13138 [Fusarium anthophilum]|uniref:FAD-binding domain-containing protein n=1 Tax=Fusarium anthophilum TaxID=48485 RepID=A0A8H4YQ97_9HYPO|nr:hypothetical protein FANTH_13138 [Fusarium anthophilum]
MKFLKYQRCTAQLLNYGDTVQVIIAGAGPVGLLLSLLLARKGIRSKVFEKNPEPDTSPRAIVHHPPILEVFKDAGIYDLVSWRGNHSAGTYWRKHIVDDGNGGTVLGPVIAEMEISKRGEDGPFEDGKFSILYMQSLQVQLLLEEATKTSMVEVQFNTPVIGLEDDGNFVIVKVEAPEGPQLFRTHGHSWPESMIAADVQRTLPNLEKFEAYFAVDKVHWGVVVPLEPITPSKPGLWRYAMAVPDVALTNDEAGDPEYVHRLLLEYVDGPRPAEYTLVRHRVYPLHQLLASTMHRGRVLLAGDAGHVNNPVGGLGLSTGLLDAELLSQALDLIFNHDYCNSQDLLAEYSAARHQTTMS